MIVDYATLQAAVSDWLARADLASAIPNFIQLAESRINRTLFVRERQRQVAGASSGGVIPVPADLERLQALHVPRGGHHVDVPPAPPHAVQRAHGSALAYTVVGDEIRLSGPDDTDYLITYFARIPALSDSNQQNWLLSKEPGLYLYGALLEASPYLGDDSRATVWATQFQTILDDCLRSDDYARYGNAPAMMVAGHAP